MILGKCDFEASADMINPAAQRPPNLANGSATNSEKGAAIYEGSGRPTEARRVTLRTPLSGLNLNWRKKDLPEQERTKHVHRFHPYLGKYNPQLVEIFLRKFFKQGDTVLDPFAGRVRHSSSKRIANQFRRIRCPCIQRDARERENCTI